MSESTSVIIHLYSYAAPVQFVATTVMGGTKPTNKDNDEDEDGEKKKKKKKKKSADIQTQKVEKLPTKFGASKHKRFNKLD